MNIFGYNLSDAGKISTIRDDYMKTTGTDRCNLYFGYSPRHSIPWGNAVLLFINSITTDNTDQIGSELIGSPDDDDYYMSFFGQTDTGNLFKVKKSGKYNGGDYPYWDSNFIVIDKFSSDINGRSSVSFETLLSEQNIANISNNFGLWRDNEGTLVEVIPYGGQKFSINTLYNTENSLYDAPTKTKLVAVGNTESSSLFSNLKFVRNIVDGSYSKCYDLSLTMINNIQTNNVVLSDTIFDLVNDFGIVMITGLSYKALVKINDVDYALIFEYATSTGAKNLTITTENFDTMVSTTERLGIFMDSNFSETNSNANRVSPIDASLLNNYQFAKSLNLNHTNPVTPTTEIFLKYLLNDSFIDHNKIKTSKVSWITQTNLLPIWPGSQTKVINGSTFYTHTYNDYEKIPEYYNISNLLIEIDMSSDFSFNFDSKYDMRRNDISGNYEIRTGIEVANISSEIFTIRELVIYFKNNSSEFVPIYYARTNISINNNGTYKFQIII